jgi:hypothetical protein
LANLGPSVAAAHPGPEQHQSRFHHRRRGDAWFYSPIRNLRENVCRESKDLFRIGNQAAENGLSFPFPKPFPFQLRNLFDELLQLLVTAYSLANPYLPRLGDTDLARFSRMTLH